MDVGAVLAEAMRKKSNRMCAECGMHAPTWVSVRAARARARRRARTRSGGDVRCEPALRQINLGVFVCHRCSGVHRGLGVHISKVRVLR